MASTWTTLRQRAIYELDVGFIIPSADISAVAAGSFTAARWGQNSNLSSTSLIDKNAGYHRFGAATAADNYRPAGAITIATGVFAQSGPTWADTTADDIEVAYYGVRWDQECLKALNRVTEFEFVTSMMALSHLSRLDGDMALSTDTLWTDVGSPGTSAKSTTSALTPWGQRSYRLVNASANEGTSSAVIRVKHGGQVSGFAIAGADVGTASFQLYDATNSAAVGTAVTHSERRPQLMVQRNVTMPDTAELARLRMLGSESTADIFWNQAWLYNHDDLSCPLPAAVAESFHAPKIVRAVPLSTTDDGVYDAGSFDFQPLQEGIDYRFVINHADAEPYKVVFLTRNPYEWPLFVEVRRPLSDLTTFAAETDSTTGPLHSVLPRFKKELMETVFNTGSRRHPDYDRTYNRIVEQLTKATRARPIESVAAEKPYWAPRLGA